MTDESQAETTEPEGGATATAEGGEEKKPKLHQGVTLKEVGPCKKHIRVEVERGDIDRILNEKYSKLRVEANVAGFRPGKVPRKIVEKWFHKDVSDQVKAEILLQSLEQLAEEHDVAPLSAPDINPSKLEIPKEGPFIYEFEVEVRPDFELPNYKGLKLRRPTRTFSDDEVVQEERKLLAPYGQLVPKPEGNAQPGDFVIADVTTRDGKRVLSELKELRVPVESRLAFKDGVAEKFQEQILGASPGQNRKVDITLSANVSDPNISGKTVQANFEVKDVKAMRLPELTHDFLHRFGVHSPEQLREKVRVLLNWRLEYQQRQSAREQVLHLIADAAKWELPQDLLARQARKTLGRQVMEMRSSGMSEEEIRGRQRLLQQDALRTTERALKEMFVLQKIAELEKIDADQDDVNEEIERIADRTDDSPRRIRARLEKEDLMESLVAEIVERKALDLILDSAEYEDFAVSAKDEEKGVAAVEEQAVEGEMIDHTAVEEKKEEEEKAE